MSANDFSVTLPSSWYTSKGIGALEKRAIFFKVVYLDDLRYVIYAMSADISFSRGFYLELSPSILRRVLVTKMNYARLTSPCAVLKMTGIPSRSFATAM